MRAILNQAPDVTFGRAGPAGQLLVAAVDRRRFGEVTIVPQVPLQWRGMRPEVSFPKSMSRVQETGQAIQALSVPCSDRCFCLAW
jgi:hypothetical protein